MPPLIKYLVVIVLCFIVYNLFKAFYHLSRNDSNPKQVVKALAIRVGLSISLFLALLFASYLGFIKPHGLLPNQPTSSQTSTISE
jgi:RsiW-degrading membrane proteinase PrsW (M82 family)